MFMILSHLFEPTTIPIVTKIINFCHSTSLDIVNSQSGHNIVVSLPDYELWAIALEA